MLVVGMNSSRLSSVLERHKQAKQNSWVHEVHTHNSPASVRNPCTALKMTSSTRIGDVTAAYMHVYTYKRTMASPEKNNGVVQNNNDIAQKNHVVAQNATYKRAAQENGSPKQVSKTSYIDPMSKHLHIACPHNL